MSIDFLQYYDLERYLFDVVSARYAKSRTLNAFDFFSIVIWKANRAKSKVADRLLKHPKGYSDLESATRVLIASIRRAKSVKQRLSVLIEDWNFRLPMASAILTVLYPDDFTVYDFRVCEVLGRHRGLSNKKSFSKLWLGYVAYLADVKAAASHLESLRDKDRYLWGQSFRRQLVRDVKSCFRR